MAFQLPMSVAPDPFSTAALGAALLLVLVWLVIRRRRQAVGARQAQRRDAVDTVTGWRPEAARVLAAHELAALRTLAEAMPGYLVLAQVPLARFLRVPTRNSYADWLARVGHLNADLMLCDADARVLAVVDIRAPQESERSQRRHERMKRVLRAAGIAVLVWRQEQLPEVAEVRAQFDVLLPSRRRRRAPETRAPASRPAPLIPVPEVTELLAEGDLRAAAAELPEPVASEFFEEFEADLAAGRH